MPFIQVVSAGTSAPSRQTVSDAGTEADEEEVDEEVGVELLELQPPAASTAASAAAVPIASLAGVLLSPTDGTPSGVVYSAIKLMRSRGMKLTGNFPIR
jgi:hypothetical protein